MPKKTFVLFIAFLPLTLLAQDISLISSVEQSWSGGIAGRHGVNYSFLVEFSHYKTEPVTDTIWIGEHPIPIIMADSILTQNVNTRMSKKKDAIQFTINAGLSFDDYANGTPVPGNEPEETKFHPPIRYRGVALLSYKCGTKKKYYEISTIMKRERPLNYP